MKKNDYAYGLKEFDPDHYLINKIISFKPVFEKHDRIKFAVRRVRPTNNRQFCTVYGYIFYMKDGREYASTKLRNFMLRIGSEEIIKPTEKIVTDVVEEPMVFSTNKEPKLVYEKVSTTKLSID